MEKKKKDCPNRLLTTLMIVCVTLSVVILGIVSYDKFIKKEDKRVDVVPVVPQGGVASTNCEKPSNFDEKVYGEIITEVEKFDLTENNQEVNFGNKTYKIKIGVNNNQGYLSIDDYFVNPFGSDGKISVQNAYLTDKYMFFTQVGQDWESIAYAIGENGEIVANNNSYQMHEFKVIDGYLHASGHIFCGLDGDCPDKDLLIKFIDNTLIVTEAK